MSEPIVITGATGGLGRALALWYLRAGHAVRGIGRDPAAVATLGEETGEADAFASVNVRDARAVGRWAAGVESRLGPPGLVVNCAAILAPRVPFWELSERDFVRSIEVNLLGAARVARAFLPGMVAAGRGLILNFASSPAPFPKATLSAYCASKAGLEELTRVLADELPPGLGAVSVYPGLVNTDMLQQSLGKEAAAHPDPDDWAERAAPMLLALDEKHSGQHLSLPEFEL